MYLGGGAGHGDDLSGGVAAVCPGAGMAAHIHQELHQGIKLFIRYLPETETSLSF